MNERIKKLMENPRRGLLILSWPLIVSMLFSTLLNFVDFFFVGGLGPNALAAVQLSFPIFFLMIAVGSGISIGATALMSKRIGEKNKKWAEEAGLHAIMLGLIVSAAATAMALVTDPLSHGLGGGIEVSHLASQYMSIIFAGSIVYFMMSALQSVLQAEGDTQTIMKVSVGFTLLNIILNPLFIYVLGMGIMGSAFATVVAEGFGLLVYVWYIIARKKTFLQIRPREFIYTPQIIKNILKVGLPAATSQLALSIAVIGVNLILGGFGDSAISAYGIGFRIDSLTILPLLGLGYGAIPLIGYFRGAKDPRGAKKVYHLALKISLAFTIALGALMFTMSWFMPHLFTTDATVIRMASDYMRYIAFAYPFIGVTIILASAFQAMGKGMPSLVITLSRAVLIVLLVSYVLAYHTSLGIDGVWVGLVSASIFSAIAAFVWIERYFKGICNACKV